MQDGGELVGQTLFGKLRVVRKLGAGAMGVVYEVEHLLTKHRRAMKVLHVELARSGEAVARLVREAGAPGKIASPYVPETFDVGRLPNGATYVLQELLEGESLRARLDRDSALDPSLACAIASEICEGLACVHEAGILHRDLKPENVFLVKPKAPRPTGPRVKVLDFGVMRVVQGDTFGALTALGRVIGTLGYMAPEQLDGAAIDARADVYAVGVMLYEMIAGKRPFEANDDIALLRAILTVSPARLVGVDPALADVICRAMHRTMEQRIATASQLRDALRPFLGARSAGLSLLAAASPYLEARYELVRFIKSGGMGAVYEVIHRETRRRCALKLMMPGALASDELRRRFRLEARVTVDIESEHLVETFDAGVDPDTSTPFLVMELLRGEELAALVQRRGALEPSEALTYLSQAALGIDKTHERGVVHRDLKPENLFVTTRDDGSPRVKILDFGIAKVLAHGAQTGALTRGPLGTPLYMAPEQFGSGEVGAATDRYALAHVAFTLLTGRAYWSEETTAGMHAFVSRVLTGPREPASARALRSRVSLPSSFDAWFATATASDPAARFRSAAEMIDALARALSMPSSSPSISSMPTGDAAGALAATLIDAPIVARSVPAGVEIDARAPRRPRSFALAVAAVALIAAAGAAALFAGRRGVVEASQAPPIAPYFVVLSATPMAPDPALVPPFEPANDAGSPRPDAPFVSTASSSSAIAKTAVPARATVRPGPSTPSPSPRKRESVF